MDSIDDLIGRVKAVNIKDGRPTSKQETINTAVRDLHSSKGKWESSAATATRPNEAQTAPQPLQRQRSTKRRSALFFENKQPPADNNRLINTQPHFLEHKTPADAGSADGGGQPRAQAWPAGKPLTDQKPEKGKKKLNLALFTRNQMK